mmetsp:Transcript_10465/g.28679  ORF Transcript_10465/g.28679 Transcript_10465/m.28679 type:complete len:519 (+) Transcript_10465:67-1623(+)
MGYLSTEYLVSLSPTQHAAVKEITCALGYVNVVQVSPQVAGEDEETKRPGFGMSTMYQYLCQSSTEVNTCLKISVKDVLRTPLVPHQASFVKAAFDLATEAWTRDEFEVVIVDDLDLLSGSSRESTALLVKCLSDYANEFKKKLVFHSTDEEALKYATAPFQVKMKPYTSRDYQFFLSLFLKQQMKEVNASEIFNQFPSLSPAELRVVCVPETTTAAGEEEGGGKLMTTEKILENISSRLGERHGSLPLHKVEKVDLTEMPGLGKVLKQLETQVIEPFENYMNPKSLYSDPKAGVLLFGPPGTGKTSIGRYLAHRLKGKMFMVKEMSLKKQLQETFAKAEASAPSVVFFDDIDVLLHRSKVAWGGGSELFRFLLGKMDGMTSNKGENKKFVTIIMTCESPKSLPDALIRSGRIELWAKLEYPKGKQRSAILQKVLKEQGDHLPEIPVSRINQIADRTEDFSPADLRRVVKDARNIYASKKMKTGDDKPIKADEVLEEAVESLRRMRDEVESFMKQMYH